jgi:hypothetical protein
MNSLSAGSTSVTECLMLTTAFTFYHFGGWLPYGGFQTIVASLPRDNDDDNDDKESPPATTWTCWSLSTLSFSFWLDPRQK